jgi:hypothetical protein
MELNMQEPTEHERKVAREEARDSGREPDAPEAEDWRRDAGIDASPNYQQEIEAERRGTDAEHVEREEEEEEPFTPGRFPSEPTR